MTVYLSPIKLTVTKFRSSNPGTIGNCVNFKVKDDDGYPEAFRLRAPITRLSTIEEPLLQFGGQHTCLSSAHLNFELSILSPELGDFGEIGHYPIQLFFHWTKILTYIRFCRYICPVKEKPSPAKTEAAKELFLNHGGILRTGEALDLGIHRRTLCPPNYSDLINCFKSRLPYRK